MSDKPKFPRAVALNVARAFCHALKPLCEWLIVAGSLRRRKEMVGDVEILYIPKTAEVREDFFDRRVVSQVDVKLDEWLQRGFIVKRLHVGGGVVSWGRWNKYARHVVSGVPVDFFATTAAAKWNYLVCRTGGEHSNLEVASAAIRKGWKWNPTGEGFTDDHGAIIPVRSERDVFEFVGLPYREPRERA